MHLIGIAKSAHTLKNLRMSWREAKAHYDSEEHSDEESYCGKMDPTQINALVESALALQERRLGEQFNAQLSVLKGQLDSMKI